jgi:hypothetical protein
VLVLHDHSYSSGHLAAAFSAASAFLHALIHATDALAILNAFLANLGALGAGMFVVGCADEHEMCGRAAHLGARHHQTKMLRLDVLAAGFKAMVHSRTQTYGVTFEACGNAGLHLGRLVVHCWLLALGRG